MPGHPKLSLTEVIWLLCGMLLLGTHMHGADWLNEGGDWRHRNWQPDERDITPSSVSNLKLMWKLRLGHGLSAPVIMGRLITYRGTVELVFVTSKDGSVWAIDGDFGRIFWTRRLAPGIAQCPSAATPALTPLPEGADPDDDGAQALRPLFVLSPGANLHSLDPVDSQDTVAPVKSKCAPALVVKNGKPARASAVPHSAAWKDGQGRWHRAMDALIAGGVAFRVARDTGELQAFDAMTQKPLYSSGPTGSSPSAVAIANGHVCFTSQDTLYCFGFPENR